MRPPFRVSSHKWPSLLLAVLVLTGLLVAWGLIARAAPAPQAADAPVATPYREAAGQQVESPAISFIDSPSATCYRPVALTDVCYIQWHHLQVTAASGAHIISMTVSIDGQLRAYHVGFFQSTMYVPGDMYNLGFQVACGDAGASSTAGFGNTYSYVIRARETGNLSSANYGSVTCPANAPFRTYLPLLMRVP